MILRFKSASSAPEYIGINTRFQSYTYNPEVVKAGTVITVAVNHFEHIRSEILFNDYNYMNDLHTEPDLDEIPF